MRMSRKYIMFKNVCIRMRIKRRKAKMRMRK